MIVYAVYLTASLLQIAASRENCDYLGTLFYEELQCEPKMVKGMCPSAFACKSYNIHSSNLCTLKGNTYACGEEVNALQSNELCKKNCRCNHLHKIECEDIICSEDGTKLSGGCYYKYALNNCCAVGRVCPPFTWRYACQVDGNTYMEGQRFSPKNKCMDCVCERGFNGTFEAPFCRKKTCGFEMNLKDKIKRNCAPLYLLKDGEVPCCPTDLLCPSKTDEIVRRMLDVNSSKFSSPLDKCMEELRGKMLINKDSTRKESSCIYGDNIIDWNKTVIKTLKINGKMQRISCTCELPPYLTCVFRY